jgi:hypothetical protein
MHLTNYSVNKSNAKFVQNEDADVDNVGSKWYFLSSPPQLVFYYLYFSFIYFCVQESLSDQRAPPSRRGGRE